MGTHRRAVSGSVECLEPVIDGCTTLSLSKRKRNSVIEEYNQINTVRKGSASGTSARDPLRETEIYGFEAGAGGGCVRVGFLLRGLSRETLVNMWWIKWVQIKG